MDAAETLFGLAWRWLRRRAAGEAAGPTVDVHDRRLLALAGLVAARPVLLRHAEGAGGVRGRVILLPERLGPLGFSAEQQAELLLLRICVAAAATADAPASAAAATPASPATAALALHQHLAAMAAARDALIAALPAAAPRLLAIGLALEAAAAAAPAAPTTPGRPRSAGGKAVDPPPFYAFLAAERGRLHRLEPLASGREAEAALADAPTRATLPAPSPLYGAPLGAADAAAADAAWRDEELRATLPTGSERRARPRDVLERVRLPTDEAPPLPVHVFEKVDTADDYRGGRRKVDGGDELEAHGDALDEVDLRAIVRGGEDVASVVRLDAHGLEAGLDAADSVAGASGDRVVLLDEWDASRNAYRRGWVRGVLRRATARDPAWAAAARLRLASGAARLERALTAERQRRRLQRRQPDGSDIDLDALIDEHAAARAGHGHYDRVDLQERRAARDVATLVVLDLSLSADAWVGGGAGGEGRRVLDLTRDAAYLVAEAAWRLGDRVALLGFGSQTRHHVELLTLLDWRERWPDAAARLGALRPRGYTRIGAALRHGRTLLERQPAQRRVLLLVTDGKPTDDDRYEGRYGVGDVRQAVREARQAGVESFALCLDRAAAATMPALFGVGGYEIVRDPLELPMRVAAAWARRAG